MTSRGRDPRALVIATATALVALAWALYRPDRARPFLVVDFSEFIPHLLAADDFGSRLRGVIEYYASQGRFNAIPYVALVAKWEAFGWWSPGWQITRALVMTLVFALTYLLLRRLGASRMGALIGGSVYLWAPAAADGWVRLTMAEPSGTAMMLGLAVRATGFQGGHRWRREVVLFALGTIALIWTKELMAPLVLLPVVIALMMQPDRSFTLPQRTPRNVALIMSASAAAVLAFAPVLAIYLTSGESAYSSMYGAAPQPLSRLLGFWIAGLAPFDLVTRPPNVLWSIALLGFTTLIAFGWPAGFRSDGMRARWLLAVALVVPLAGTLVYLPNPWFARFYSLPYLIGPAILSGMAITFLQSYRARGEALAIWTTAAFSIQAIVAGATLAARSDAVQRRDAAVIAFVADSIRADTVLFATLHPPPYEWLGIGSSLRRFAEASGHPWPPLRYVHCNDARQAAAAARATVMIDIDSFCELADDGSHVTAVRFRKLDPTRLSLAADSVHARFIVPATLRRAP